MTATVGEPAEERRASRRAGPRLLSVVIPLNNEEEGVVELVDRVVGACGSLDIPFEVVVVNDGSRDATLIRLVEMSARVDELRVIDLLRNFGHMAALAAGLSSARGDAAVVMDGDLQDPPEIIPALVQQWRAGADVVLAVRSARGESVVQRVATSAFYRMLSRFSTTPIPRDVGTFCLVDRRLIDVLNALPERSRFFAGLRAWAGGREAHVPYVRERRRYGRSRVGVRGLFGLAGVAFTSFSKAPLRIASLLSLTCGLLLLVVGVTAILVRLSTNLAIPGWATYTTLIGLMGSVQSIVLAVISEYVGVVFDEVKARPLYLVREEFLRGGSVPRLDSLTPVRGRWGYSSESESSESAAAARAAAPPRAGGGAASSG